MERAAEIRGFTKPSRPIALSKIREYARVAARWEEQRRIMARGDSTPAQDEQFLTLSAMLRSLIGSMYLPVICTEQNANADGVVGITDRNGFLSRDPARILFDSWTEANLSPTPEKQRLLER